MPAERRRPERDECGGVAQVHRRRSVATTLPASRSPRGCSARQSTTYVASLLSAFPSPLTGTARTTIFDGIPSTGNFGVNSTVATPFGTIEVIFWICGAWFVPSMKRTSTCVTISSPEFLTKTLNARFGVDWIELVWPVPGTSFLLPGITSTWTSCVPISPPPPVELSEPLPTARCNRPRRYFGSIMLTVSAKCESDSETPLMLALPSAVEAGRWKLSEKHDVAREQAGVRVRRLRDVVHLDRRLGERRGERRSEPLEALRAVAHRRLEPGLQPAQPARVVQLRRARRDLGLLACEGRHRGDQLGLGRGRVEQRVVEPRPDVVRLLDDRVHVGHVVLVRALLRVGLAGPDPVPADDDDHQDRDDRDHEAARAGLAAAARTAWRALLTVAPATASTATSPRMLLGDRAVVEVDVLEEGQRHTTAERSGVDPRRGRHASGT